MAGRVVRGGPEEPGAIVPLAAAGLTRAAALAGGGLWLGRRLLADDR